MIFFLNIYFPERQAAVEMCQQLVDRNFGQSIKKGPEDFRDDNSIYQFIEDVQANALNAGIISQCEPRPGLYFTFQFEYSRILLS